jgi:Leucine-rich repeat (LRR) protein
MGKLNLDDSNELGSVKYSVFDIIFYPHQFSEASKFNSDVALALLSDHVMFTNVIAPICLPKSDEDLFTSASVVGWEGGHHSHVYVPIKEKKVCLSQASYLIDEHLSRTFCSGLVNVSKSLCKGEFGAAVYGYDWTNNPDVYVIRGILAPPMTELGGCEIEVLALYTNVALFLDWIELDMDTTREISWIYVEFDFKENSEGIIIGAHNMTEKIARNLKIANGYSGEFSQVDLTILDFSPSPYVLKGIGDHFSTQTKLELRGSIKFVQRSDFSNLPNLTELGLQNNLIEFLPDDVFNDLCSLESLNLDSNKIKKIRAKTFADSRNLKRVNLSNNLIKCLPKDLFATNLFVGEIDLHKNPLKIMEVDFANVPHLTRLIFYEGLCLATNKAEDIKLQQVFCEKCQ